jgi:hypothetical protein
VVDNDGVLIAKYYPKFDNANGNYLSLKKNKRPMGHIAHLSSLGQYKNIFFQY